MFGISWLGNRLVQAGIVLALVLAIIYAITSYIDGVYEDGKAEGIRVENAVWLEREKERVAEQNKKIDDIEKKAHELAKKGAADLAASEEKVRALNEKVRKLGMNTRVYTASNEPIPCAPGTEIYLGTDFSKSWNDYNGVLK